MLPFVLTLSIVAAGPDYWALRAQEFAAVEEWTAAIDNADEAVRLDHENPYRYLERAAIKLKAKRFADALGDANRAELRFRRYGVQTMAPPYMSGEIYRLNAAYAGGDLNAATVRLGIIDFDLKRLEDKLRAEAPAPEPAAAEAAPADEPNQGADRVAQLSEHLKEAERLREEAYDIADRFSSHQELLEKAKESYSVAIGRLPPSPHPYAGRQLAEEALRGSDEVLKTADELRERVDAVYESLLSSLRALQSLQEE